MNAHRRSHARGAPSRSGVWRVLRPWPSHQVEVRDVNDSMTLGEAAFVLVVMVLSLGGVAVIAHVLLRWVGVFG